MKAEKVLGERFGMLVAIDELPRERGMRKWRLRCDCGAEIEALQKTFKSGGCKRSCGCAPRRHNGHGLSSIPEYRHWINMIERCEYPGVHCFARYGGRGIKVCQEWRNSFEKFLEDMGHRPSPDYSVDRIDGDGNYEPGNCRWATRKEQQRNVSRNKIVQIADETMTLAEAVERSSLKYNTVLYRIKRGWSIERALELPNQRRHYEPVAA